MKTSVCFLFTLVLLTTNTFAQQRPEKLDYLIQMEKARKMKRVGGVLTILGGLSMIVGNCALRSAFMTGEEYGNTATISYTIGIAGLASGIPLLAVGTTSEKKYKARMDGLAVKLSSGSLPKGLTLSYRF